MYSDLISQEDRDFWLYLCKKDFRRLDKLVNKSMGEGHFIGDSGDDESDDQEKEQKNTDNYKEEPMSPDQQQGDDDDPFSALLNMRHRQMDRGGRVDRNQLNN